MWRAFRRLPSGGQALVLVAMVAAVAVAVAVAAAFGGRSPTTATSGVGTAADPARVPAGSAGGACHARGSGLYVLPDPACTPGAANPAVSQADIATTICRTGWTRTVRPPESYTEPLKRHQMAAYGDTGTVSSYEEDHLIPLELGGNPTSPANLWPEPGASPNPKDRVESAARRAVCDGSVPLATAQADMASDWIALGRQLGAQG